MIAALALLVVLRPELALHLLTVALGAYGLFYAACEALALIAPAERRRRKTRRPPLRVAIGGGALVAALVVAALVLALSDDDGEVERPAGPVANCNGYAELCDLTLDDVSFPAAHNAMSSGQAGFYAPNHRYDIRRQLNDGIRAFLIDSHYGIRRGSGPVLTDLSKEERSKVVQGVREQLGPEGARSFLRLQQQFATRGGDNPDSVPYFCHVVCELGSLDMVKSLRVFKDFLDTHPDEFVILFVEDQVTPKDTEKAFERSGILRYAYVHERDTPFPVLRELIESDRRLLVMAEADSGDGSIPWYHDGFELAQETPFIFDSQQQLADPAYGCSPNRGKGSSPLFQLNHWIEDLPRSPKTAAKVNAFVFLERRARECQRRRGLHPNIVAVDFHDRGEVVGVTRILNGLPRGEQPSYRTTD